MYFAILIILTYVKSDGGLYINLLSREKSSNLSPETRINCGRCKANKREVSNYVDKGRNDNEACNLEGDALFGWKLVDLRLFDVAIL